MKKIFDEKRRFINNYVFETLPKIQATDPYFGYILEHLFTDSTKITLEELNNKLVVVSSNPNMHVKNTLCFLTDKICAMAKVELDNSHSKLIEYRYKTILNSILPPKIGPLFAHILN
ncbi:MAG TPA: hypothetical protein PKD85_00700 [Saprospiraceae bacterium]|nr:hypothetical protein [Saprospiraceae bacterium]